jgi:4-diphosphocytidyl-2-C-methyl-D-erythritol kinase
VPADKSNIAFKAAQSILEATDRTSWGVRIELSKLIPSQAGLGGGSSDAAAVLLGVNSLLGEPLDVNDLCPLARQLGADVSFFLHGGMARVRGIGEIVEPIEWQPHEPFVIVKPECGVSTAEAYRALDGIAGRQSARSTSAWPSCSASNDFEAVVFELAPGLRAERQNLLDAGARSVLLCGSGSALAAFMPDAWEFYRSAHTRGVRDISYVAPMRKMWIWKQ